MVVATSGDSAGAGPLVSRALLRRIRATPRFHDLNLLADTLLPAASAADRANLVRLLRRQKPLEIDRDPTRLVALQAALSRQNLRGFILPRNDAHQGEYIALNAERIQWLTGFSGSAGTAVILIDKAALFVDGRYTLQAPAETAGCPIECRNFREPLAPEWLAGEVSAGDRIGYDPNLHSVRDLERWQAALTARGAKLVPLSRNPVDRLWRDRPGDPFAPAFVHPLPLAGEESAAKRRRIGAAIAQAGAQACILNQLDSIAWLLNIRGGDTPSTPLVQSFAILFADGRAEWFVDPAKLSPGLADQLGPEVAIKPLQALDTALQTLGGQHVMIDPDATTAAIQSRLVRSRATLVRAPDPVVLPKARKNATECDGTRAAHRRDGAIMVRFLAWLDAAIARSGKAGKPLDELRVMDELERFRHQDERYRGPSFTTIAGAGENGAIVHYRASPATNRPLASGSFLLLDCGAQYPDGTTDITRTIPIGEVSAEMRRHFTLVLKGNIAVATARFPKGTNGVALDGFARRALWQAGLNFDHGTGHGVGSYLGVHEGPARLSPLGMTALEPGMILSNEPGYYRTKAYGIRIETLVLVQEGSDGFLDFETLTLCPIDRRAIDRTLLDDSEWRWLNAYHQRVREALVPQLSGRARTWLLRMTRPI